MSQDRNYPSPLKMAAIQMHELYIEMKAAGFTRKEALYLVSQMISSAMHAAVESSDNDNDNDFE